ncbi:transcription factor glial cells missing [Caerostris extrusa]|uniref:Transcription factor glial cells missing n=1 Tax=Caerostris extrusa TaxID=172846 RepID=A0AAV4SSI0_CAEEX|nr:transcription factor glial cells missing [Caerostris extrusa]
MKDDYVVTSLDDPDVSQRFFAAIDNLLLQDYGNGDNFMPQSDGTRESDKCIPDHLQPSWDTNPPLSSFFGHPQHHSSDLGYSSEYTEATPKEDPFMDHSHQQELKMADSFGPSFSASMQESSVICGRGLELVESELILPHRTNGQQMPF